MLKAIRKLGPSLTSLTIKNFRDLGNGQRLMDALKALPKLQQLRFYETGLGSIPQDRIHTLTRLNGPGDL